MTSSTDAPTSAEETRRNKDLMFLEGARDYLGVPTVAWGLGLLAARLGIVPEHFLSPGRLAISVLFVALAGLVLITPVLFAAWRTRREPSRPGVLTAAIVMSAIVLGFLSVVWPEMLRW